MPKTSEDNDDDQVDRGPRPSNPVAAEWNIKVIAQKGGKRDMPAPPEIGEAKRSVRQTKIILEMKAETESRANRAGGITGEIEKDLAGEGEDAHPGVECDERSAVT